MTVYAIVSCQLRRVEGGYLVRLDGPTSLLQGPIRRDPLTALDSAVEVCRRAWYDLRRTMDEKLFERTIRERADHAVVLRSLDFRLVIIPDLGVFDVQAG